MMKQQIGTTGSVAKKADTIDEETQMVPKDQGEAAQEGSHDLVGQNGQGIPVGTGDLFTITRLRPGGATIKTRHYEDRMCWYRVCLNW